MRVNVECLAVGVVIGMITMGAGAWWWYHGSTKTNTVTIKSPPTVIKVPVIVYKQEKYTAGVPGQIKHNPALQILARSRVDRRDVISTIDTVTGAGSIYIAPRPFISFRNRGHVSVYEGILNGRPDARIAGTMRLVRVGAVDVNATAAADQILQAYVGVGVSYYW